jgi:glycosyltransferase involved in cell wall biosynthesis
LNNKKNILQLVNGFGVGGGELKLLELVKRLDKKKYNITIVSVGQGGDLERQFRELGHPVYILYKSGGFDMTLPFKLAKIMKQHKVDLMMSTLFYADIIGALATLFYIPKIFISWEVITGQLKWYQKLAYKTLSFRFDMVAAVSNSIHHFIKKERGQNPEKITTIYYGVDLTKYSPVQKPPNKEIVFGTVARLVFQKGHTYLLDAIKSTNEKFPNARWKFVGGGYMENELKEKTTQLGLLDVVEFLGNSENIPEQLQAFDVFVLPSLWEGFPNVLLEAMASGLPVIATSVEGTVELVVDATTGLLVPKKDPTSLYLAMEKILYNPNLIMEFGNEGRKRVEENFSVEKQVNEFEELYDSLLNKN